MVTTVTAEVLGFGIRQSHRPSVKALAGYNRTARPFNWKFSADDLTALLRRTSQHEQVPVSQQTDRPQAA